MADDSIADLSGISKHNLGDTGLNQAIMKQRSALEAELEASLSFTIEENMLAWAIFSNLPN